MSIRIRLTVLVSLLTAAVCAISLWLGLGVLRGVAVDGALDPQLGELEFLMETGESEIVTDPEVLRIAGAELQYLFRPDTSWEPSVTPATTERLIDEFGVDEVLYVSGARFFAGVETVEWVWPVDEEGTVLTPVELSQVPDDAAVVPVPVLYELIDYSVADRSAQLAFDRVEFDRTLYGLAVDATDELSAIDNVSGILWASAGLLVILAAATTWFISGRALAPVQAMTRKVEVLSSTDLEQRLPGADRSDEIGNLAATLNGMLARMEHSDRRRRRFVSDASHELRTPLAVLTNQAEVARSAPETTSLDELAAVVESESDRMASMVEDLLLLARHDEVATATVTGGTNGVSVFDVDDVVLDEIARTRRLPVDGSAVSAGRVRGDAVATARAVAHLLDNAARHGESKVAVSLWTDGDRVVLCVEDDGAGIPESRRAEVFERFTRLDDSRSRDQGGAGLGLSVVSATFSAMGGTVTVDRSPLAGARFLVSLPAA